MASRTKSPKQSLEDHRIHRHSSASSVHSDRSSQADHHNRRRQIAGNKSNSTSTSTRFLTAALEDQLNVASEPLGFQVDSRRESSSSMRTSTTPLEGPITYTPTTHRVSKAKKGKRVHACEFPGCNKIFTRAEHRRRHELNHSPEASYPCNREGCRRAFHRPDLLQRHQERHDLDTQSEGTGSHRRNISETSNSSGVPSINAPSVMPPTLIPAPTSGPHSSGIPITQIVNPPPTDHRYRNNISPYNGLLSRPATFLPGIASECDDSSDYLYESSQSPPDYHQRHSHRTSLSSDTPVVLDFHPGVSSPLLNTSMPAWEPVLMPPSAFPMNAVETDRNGFVSSQLEPSVQLPLSALDGHEWMVIRRELSSRFGAIPSDDGTWIFDTDRWQNCLDCYWRYFHPLFPVVHRPTFFATKPSPLMASAMVSIGSQYDTREDAKEYSIALLEAATKLLSKRDTINSRSRLTDLQTVFLLEVLTKYRSRRASVQVSPRFRSFYASLTQARQWISTNPLAVFRGLGSGFGYDELANAHNFWSERETRRRLLQASFILDTQQAALFEQQPALVPIPMAQLKTTDLKSDLPFPCTNELWESSPIEDWAKHATAFDNIDLQAASKEKLQGGTRELDAFQSRLVLSHIMTTSNTSADLDTNTSTLKGLLETRGDRHTQFTLHALLLARNTPIRPLLTVSGETWLLGKKMDHEADFAAAKQKLREWVNTKRGCQVAHWHAVKILRIAFDISTTSNSGTGPHNSHAELNMLHEQWCIYFAGLVCWAMGFGTSTSSSSPGVHSSANSTISEPLSHSSSSSGLSMGSAYPPLLDALEAYEEMKEYLRVTDVARPEDLSGVDPAMMGRTDGLLEVIRTKRLGGPMGELLNEAERVLYRLVEGKSKLSHF